MCSAVGRRSPADSTLAARVARSEALHTGAGHARVVGAGERPALVVLQPHVEHRDVAALDAAGGARRTVEASGDAAARRVEDLCQAVVLPDRRAERRRRLAIAEVGLREFCEQRRLPMSSQMQLEKAWDAWQAERYRRGEVDTRPDWSANPWRPR